MLPLMFSFALTLAGMDAGAAMDDLPWQPRVVAEHSIILLQQVEARLSSGPVFVGGEVRAFGWKVADELIWWEPDHLVSKVAVGLDFGWLEVGWKHVCIHPDNPWQSVTAPPLLLETWHDIVYVRVRYEVRLR